MTYRKAENPLIRALMLSLLLIPVILSTAGCGDDQVQLTLEDISEPIDLAKLQQYLPGTWEGSFKMAGGEYTVRFSLHENEDGTFIGAFSVPQQTQALFIFDEIEIDEQGEITFRASSIQAGYTATLRAVQDSQQITLSGTWQQNGTQAYLTMEPRQIEHLTRIMRPQDPVPPFPYHEEEVQFSSTEDDILLSGTLTYPEGNGPFPAVILLSGSGSSNRDEEISGHRPFLVLADYLTRNGIAVLRYDDRGVGESEGDALTATSRDLSIDGEAALDYLLSRTDIASDIIGIIGHSEGGLIGPMVADRREEVKFLVLLAGPGIRGDQVLLTQTRAILEAHSLPSSLIQTTLSTNKAVYDLLLEEDDEQVIIDEVYRVMQSVGVPEDQIEKQISSIMLPWFRFFVQYDPGNVLSRTVIPVLALNGSLDLQIIAEENIPSIRDHLESAGNQYVTTKIYQGLNHLFQPAETGMVDEYGTTQITIDPEVLDDVTQWILAVTEGYERLSEQQ